MSTFERLTLSEYDDGPCPWPADVYRTALKAAYAENDRLEAEDLARADDRIVYYESIIAEKDAEIDRLRANALEWVTVTDDPATLPDIGRLMVLMCQKRSSITKTEISAHEAREWLESGDRWAYIPDVQMNTQKIGG